MSKSGNVYVLLGCMDHPNDMQETQYILDIFDNPLSAEDAKAEYENNEVLFWDYYIIEDYLVKK